MQSSYLSHPNLLSVLSVVKMSYTTTSPYTDHNRDPYAGLSFYFPCPSRHTLNVPKMIFQSTQKLRSCIYLMSRSIHSLKDRIAISVFIVLLSFFFRSRNPCPFSYDSVLFYQFYHNLPITSIVFLSSRSPFYRCRSVFLFALFNRIFLFYRKPP